MSGGLTEATSLRRLTQAFRMATLCCSPGSVTVSQAPGQAFYAARAHSKSLFLNFGTRASDPMQQPVIRLSGSHVIESGVSPRLPAREVKSRGDRAAQLSA